MKLGGLFSQRDALYEELKRSRKTRWNARAAIITIIDKKYTRFFLSIASLHFVFRIRLFIQAA